MVRLFSKRHEQALLERRIPLTLARRLRRRIWSTLQRHDQSFNYQPDPNDNWVVSTTTLEQLPSELCHRYGAESLVAFIAANSEERGPVNLQGFVEHGYPGQVLDVVELFYSEIPDDQKLPFQKDLNLTFEEEGSDWRLTDGQFFRVDSAFLQMNVIARSYELLKAEGFEGALDEFNQARNDLASGDPKGAIHNACKSFESVLKAVLKTDTGNASSLVRRLQETGFYSDIPDDVGRAFGEQVLMALPFLRNRLGGHGQGTTIVPVPRLYGELAVNLAGTLLLFTILRAVELSGSRQANQTDGGESEVPF